MPIALTIEIPDHIYEPLKQKATQTGQTPEQIASAWIETAAKRLTDDPLLKLAGVFESELSDISERHDEYIGAQESSSHVNMHSMPMASEFDKAEWKNFIKETYGSLADNPTERGDQGKFEIRDDFR